MCAWPPSIAAFVGHRLSDRLPVMTVANCVLCRASAAEAEAEIGTTPTVFVLVTFVIGLFSCLYILYASAQLRLREQYPSVLAGKLASRFPPPSEMYIGPAKFTEYPSLLESQPWRVPGAIALRESTGFLLQKISLATQSSNG